MAEVSDSELAILRNSFKLIQDLDKDPAAKAHLERAIKVVKPDVQTDEDKATQIVQPILDRMEKELAARDERIEKLVNSASEQEQTRQIAEIDGAFTRLASQGYTDDGIAKIKQLMVDRKIADPEAAAALFDRQNPPAPAEQPGWTPDHWNMEETVTPTNVKELFANEDKWADKMAAQVLNEIRVGQAA